MKSTGAVQTVAVLLLLASAASCEVGKEYTNRVFKPVQAKKTKTTSIKFMQSDSTDASIFTDSTMFAVKDVKDSTKTDVAVVEPVKTGKNQSTGTVRTKKVRQ